MGALRMRPGAAAAAASAGSVSPLMVVMLLVSAATFGMPALLPAITDSLALPPTAIGLVWAVVGGGRLLAELPAGQAADRWPAARNLGVAGAVLTVGSVLMVTASAVGVLLVGAGLVGAASALTGTVGMAAFARGAPAAKRGRAMARYATAVLTGEAIGPGLAGAMTSLWGWTTALAAMGAVGGAATAATATFTTTLAPPGNQPETAGSATARMRFGVLAALLSVPFATFFGLSGLVMTLGPLLGAQRGFSAAAIGAVLLVGGGGGLVGAWVAGHSADQHGRKSVLLPCLAVMVMGALLLAVPHTLAWVGAMVLLSLGSQGIEIAAAVLGDLAPAATTGRLLGRYRLAGDAGLLAGPVVSVGLLELGLGAAVVPTVGVLLASAAAVLVVVPESHRGLGRYRPRHVRTRRRHAQPRHRAGPPPWREPPPSREPATVPTIRRQEAIFGVDRLERVAGGVVRALFYWR